MKHTLHITVGQGPVWQVMAETDLGDFPVFIHPDFVEGRLLGLSKEELPKLRFPLPREPVIVGISGKRYKFDRLEPDGAFRLRKGWM